MAEFDFNIGARVMCEDGKCGRLHKVVVDRETQEVSDLVVEKGFLMKQDRVLPIELVDKATQNEIRLSVTGDQLSRFEAYDEKTVEVPSPPAQRADKYEKGEAVRWRAAAAPYGVVTSKPVVPMMRQRIQEGISAKKTVLEARISVENAEGDVGTVDHVLVDAESGDIEHVIVDRGLLARSVIVPASAIREITEETVFIDLSNDELDQLPRYRPPASSAMIAKLEQRLEDAPFDLGNVQVVMDGSVVQLLGTGPSIAGKRRAEAAARSIKGVVDVENKLDTDTAIEARVLAALADDPRTELADISAACDRGIVTLTGQVDNAEIREAAEEVAERQTSVVEVINDLAIGSDEDSELLDAWRWTAGLRTHG
jgi:uncharacterized protein YrrD